MQNSKSVGMYVRESASVTATQCQFMEKEGDGMLLEGRNEGKNTKARLNDCTIHVHFAWMVWVHMVICCRGYSGHSGPESWVWQFLRTSTPTVHSHIRSDIRDPQQWQ